MVGFSGWLVTWLRRCLMVVAAALNWNVPKQSCGNGSNFYGGVVLQAIQEVEDALVEERQQRQFLEHLQEQLQANAKVLARTRELYLAGVFDYLRVLEAQTSQQSLQVQDIAARRDVLLRRLDLYRALAGRWAVPRPSSGVAPDDPDPVPEPEPASQTTAPTASADGGDS